MRKSLCPLALGLGLAVPNIALAQGGPDGIAFVQAPEQSWGVAMGATPAEAFARATAQCVEGGALAEDCLQTNWCQPAGWSVDLFVMHQEGIHWHEVVCGLPNEEIAQAVAAEICDKAAREMIIECDLVQVYDHDGALQMAE